MRGVSSPAMDERVAVPPRPVAGDLWEAAPLPLGFLVSLVLGVVLWAAIGVVLATQLI